MSVTTALEQSSLRSEAASKLATGHIAGPLYDWVFFIGSPLIALAIGIGISGTPFADDDIELFGNESPLANILIGTFIMAHLGIVFFRSHLNSNVFRQFPVRFTVVPVALFTAMYYSVWVSVIVSVLAVWWDVYHSGMQTFGLCRIYDAKRGDAAEVGRQLDKWLNLLLYAGPILAGATLMDHVEDFEEFEEVGAVFFTSIPAKVESNQRYLTWTIFAVGIPFLTFYCWKYWQYYRQGYQVSIQKVALLVFTGVCSIYTWGFNTFGEAFFIMNFFHALQYFAIVWWLEKKNLVSILKLQNSDWGKPLALTLLLVVGFGYGFWAEMSDGENHAAYCVIMMVAIMHFWYDGFVWSVRRKMV